MNKYKQIVLVIFSCAFLGFISINAIAFSRSNQPYKFSFVIINYTGKPLNYLKSAFTFQNCSNMSKQTLLPEKSVILTCTLNLSNGTMPLVGKISFKKFNILFYDSTWIQTQIPFYYLFPNPGSNVQKAIGIPTRVYDYKLYPLVDKNMTVVVHPKRL